MKTRHAVLGLALAGGLALTGCATAAPPDTPTDPATAPTQAPAVDDDVQAQMDELYQEAIASGETSVVIYGPGQQPFEVVYEQFMAEYPEIEITGDYIFGAELNARLDQEFTSGKHVGAIQIGAAPVTFSTYSADRFQPYEPFTYPDSERPDPGEIGPEGMYRALVGYMYGMAYNTDLVAEDNLPDTIDVLVDPAWKGMSVEDDPTTVSGYVNGLTQLRLAGAIDEDWIKRAAENDPQILARTPLAVQAIASGQAAIGYTTYLYTLPLTEQGLPIEYLFKVDDRYQYQPFYLGLYKNAPSDAASKLFFNWAFSKEGQAAYSAVGVYGLRDDAPPPPDMPPLSEVRESLLPAVPDDEWQAATKASLEMTNKYFK